LVVDIVREIVSQPSVWRKAAERVGEVVPYLPGRGRRLAAIGCGTSYYVAQAVAGLRESAGFGESDAFPASEVPATRRYDGVLAISRSGRTTEVVRALERISPEVPTLAICAVADTEVERAADHTTILEFADENSIVQTRFATAVLALMRAHFRADLDVVVEEAEEALEAPLPDNVEDFDHFVFLSSGWGVGLANEAALKMREAAGAWTEAYPAREYRHGPIGATRPTTLVWALGPVESDIIASAAKAGATVIDSGRDPMAELVVVQRAAVAVAQARGLDPSRPRHLTRAVVLGEAQST
jgi:fructoselysine-6-P-deglycase FrlB-like protein